MVRAATVEDLPTIREILTANGIEVGKFYFDDDACPWWLVYEKADGSIVGCVMVCVSKPLAWVDAMAVRPDLIYKGYGAKLWRAALRRCRQMGCRGVFGVIAEDNEKHLRHAEKQGFYRLDEKCYGVVKEIQ